MALENFKPTIWTARLLANLQDAHVLGQITNRDYEGEIQAAGDTVKIQSIGRIDVNDYDADAATPISYANLQDSTTKLVIDQEKYFAFKVDDVDKVQSRPEVMNEAMSEASYGLSETSDQFLAGFYTDAATTITETSFDEDNVFELFAETKQKMVEKSIPSEMRKWMVVEPFVYKYMVLADIFNNQDNSQTIVTGSVGEYMGFDVYVSNNLESGHSMAGTYNALAFAEQILDMEALRLEDSFSDAMRGLYVYGAKIIRPEGLVDLEISE